MLNNLTRKAVVRRWDARPSSERMRVSYLDRTGASSLMVNIRLTRFVRRHCRVAVVWASIPLAVLNGRTVVGCGCTGHFESACHCECCSEMQDGCKQQHGKFACPCCSSHSSSSSDCCCCNRSEATHHFITTSSDSQAATGQVRQSQRCTSMVLHEVIPVAVSPSVNAGELHAPNVVLADFSLPFSFGQSVAQAVDFDTGPPPNDLVVTLHRLVI